jgi:hypothetical protein
MTTFDLYKIIRINRSPCTIIHQAPQQQLSQYSSVSPVVRDLSVDALTVFEMTRKHKDAESLNISHGERRKLELSPYNNNNSPREHHGGLASKAVPLSGGSHVRGQTVVTAGFADISYQPKMKLSPVLLRADRDYSDGNNSFMDRLENNSRDTTQQQKQARDSTSAASGNKKPQPGMSGKPQYIFT